MWGSCAASTMKDLSIPSHIQLLMFVWILLPYNKPVSSFEWSVCCSYYFSFHHLRSIYRPNSALNVRLAINGVLKMLQFPVSCMENGVAYGVSINICFCRFRCFVIFDSFDRRNWNAIRFTPALQNVCLQDTCICPLMEFVHHGLKYGAPWITRCLMAPRHARRRELQKLRYPRMHLSWTARTGKTTRICQYLLFRSYHRKISG